MTAAVQPTAVPDFMDPLLQRGARDLTWGIKTSFRTYFERLPDHAYDLSGGAVRTEGGGFRFPGRGAPTMAENGVRVIPFSGRLVLTAHFGALSVLIADPEVLVSPQGRVSLSATVDEVEGRAACMVIADLAFQGMGAEQISPEANFSASLARDGQYLFMGNYYTGDPLDPVSMRSKPLPERVTEEHQ
jgi:hypothetical protein